MKFCEIGSTDKFSTAIDSLNYFCVNLEEMV